MIDLYRLAQCQVSLWKVQKCGTADEPEKRRRKLFDKMKVAASLSSTQSSQRSILFIKNFFFKPTQKIHITLVLRSPSYYH